MLTFVRIAVFGACLGLFACAAPRPAPIQPSLQLELHQHARAPKLGAVQVVGAAAVEAVPEAPPACDESVSLPEVEADLRFSEFVERLAQIADASATEALRGEFDAFAAEHQLDPEAPQLWQDYRRLRALFEAVRDGGSWRLRWAITDQEPTSRLIWRAWESVGQSGNPGAVTANAECDELSSLYSFLARRLGVRGVGLFYPTWNHTIATWTPTQRPKGSSLLIPNSDDSDLPRL
ncbi:MAG: hypothetical protein QM756_34160 [Polyangiaceae bacterium]